MIRITNEQARPGGIRRKHEIEVEAKSRENRRQKLLYELAHLLKKIERHPDVVFVSGSQANIRLHRAVKIRASSGKQSEILRQLAIVGLEFGRMIGVIDLEAQQSGLFKLPQDSLFQIARKG